MTKIVVDTNVWLHCRFFRELPWVEIVGDDTEILIPPVLLRELDKHKNGPRPHLRDRARRVVRELEEILRHSQTNVRVSDRLTMTMIAPELAFPDGLDKDVADDRFLATILAYPEPRPLFASNDGGVRIRARGMGLAVLETPETWLLQDEPDEAQQLKRELEAIKSTFPKPGLTFANKKTHKSAVVRSVSPPADLFVELVMTDLKNHYPERPNPGAMLGISDPFAQAYNKSLTKFFERYEKYFRDLASVESRRELFVPISLSVSNEGSGPADDVEVILNVDLNTVVPFEKRPKRPKSPSPPDKNDVLGFGRASLPPGLNSSMLSNLIPAAGAEVEGPLVEFGSNEVRFRLRRVKHAVPVTLPTFYLQLRSFQDAKGFAIEYAIHAANLRKAVEGALNVSIETRTLSFDEFVRTKGDATKKRLAPDKS